MRTLRSEWASSFHPDPPLGTVLRGQRISDSQARICITQSPVWGFDVWYRMAPIVVSYAARLNKITVGVANVETAELLFGNGGLNRLWSLFGEGWGGRESVGGSPRGLKLEFDQVYTVAETLRTQLK